MKLIFNCAPDVLACEDSDLFILSTRCHTNPIMNDDTRVTESVCFSLPLCSSSTDTGMNDEHSSRLFAYQLICYFYSLSSLGA